jgi:hypothetical protein
MPIGIVKNLVRLVILLISVECILPTIIQEQASNSQQHLTIHAQSTKSTFLSLVFEKSEEERSEEERDKHVSVELADFTKQAIFLSWTHTPLISFISFERYLDSQPPLFMLFGVFII